MLHAYLLQLILGLGVTLKVAVYALIFGLILGLLGALCEFSKHTWIRYTFITFNTIIRGVPELLVLFFIYFGSAEVLNHLFNNQVAVSSFAAGVIALGLIFGAYASQTLRGAFLAVPTGQIEAAKALGLNRRQSFSLILLPQAWRHALPGLGNLWLVLLKDTALVSLIGLSDLMMRTQAAAVTTQQPFTFYLAAATIYLMITSISELLMTVFHWRTNRSIQFKNITAWH